MKNSKIEWCDHTFNPWIGCTKVSPGCDNCYAEAMMDHRLRKVKWGKGQPRLANKALGDRYGHHSISPWAWNLEARETKTRHRVFCGSLCDWLDPEAPVELLARLLVLIERTPNLDWLLLTKRPELWVDRMRAVLTYFTAQGGWTQTAERVAAWLRGAVIPHNIWIGTTVENQAMADKRIPQLLKIPARVRFLSCEPLLGCISIPDAFDADGFNPFGAFEEGIHWVICGGESGSNARPMHPAWAQSLRDQCAGANVPFFFKQWGEFVPGGPDHITECGITTADPAVVVWPHGRVMKADNHNDEWFQHCRAHASGACKAEWGTIFMHRVGKRRAGRKLDGRTWGEVPKLNGKAAQ